MKEYFPPSFKHANQSVFKIVNGHWKEYIIYAETSYSQYTFPMKRSTKNTEFPLLSHPSGQCSKDSLKQKPF